MSAVLVRGDTRSRSQLLLIGGHKSSTVTPQQNTGDGIGLPYKNAYGISFTENCFCDISMTQWLCLGFKCCCKINVKLGAVWLLAN